MELVSGFPAANIFGFHGFWMGLDALQNRVTVSCQSISLGMRFSQDTEAFCVAIRLTQQSIRTQF